MHRPAKRAAAAIVTTTVTAASTGRATRPLLRRSELPGTRLDLRRLGWVAVRLWHLLHDDSRGDGAPPLQLPARVYRRHGNLPAALDTAAAAACAARASRTAGAARAAASCIALAAMPARATLPALYAAVAPRDALAARTSDDALATGTATMR